jgi:hypothetical protein
MISTLMGGIDQKLFNRLLDIVRYRLDHPSRKLIPELGRKLGEKNIKCRDDPICIGFNESRSPYRFSVPSHTRLKTSLRYIRRP